MVLRVRLARHQPDQVSYLKPETDFVVWKRSYLIPLRYFLLLIEVLALLVYMGSVLVPSTHIFYRYRQCFTSIFFLDEHEAPISSTPALNDYYQDIERSAESVQHDFMLDVEFPDPSSPVHHRISYVNGSTELATNLNIDAFLLKNVTTILTTIPVFVFSSRKDYPGCTFVNTVLSVSKIKSDPAFFLSSRFVRSQCPLDRINRHIDVHSLPFYRNSIQTMVPLLAAAVTLFIFDLFEFKERYNRHKNWIACDSHYRSLQGRKQIHYSIGWWLFIEIVTTAFLIVAGSVVLFDLRTVTELPSLNTLEIISGASLFTFMTTMQWLKSAPYSYYFAAIIREGSGMLINVLIGFAPVLMAFFLAGIFIFAHWAPKTRSIWSMIEILISFTLGDNIQPTYVEFSDGTPLFNWLAFAYVTLLVLVAGWVVFASFTATISFITQKISMKEKQD